MPSYKSLVFRILEVGIEIEVANVSGDVVIVFGNNSVEKNL